MTAALFAQDAPPQQPFWANPMFMIGMMVLFWVVVILPMSRRQKKDQANLLSGLKRGSKVLTASGIVGTVVGAKDGEDEIVIRSEDTRLRIKRNTVTQVLGSDETEAAK